MKTGDFPVNQAAIKMLTKLVEKQVGLVTGLKMNWIPFNIKYAHGIAPFNITELDKLDFGWGRVMNSFLIVCC